MSAMAINSESVSELGYIFLEDCIVTVTPSDCVLPSREWLDLNLNSSTSTESGDDDNLRDDTGACSRCEMLVHTTKEESTERFKLQLLNNSVRFSGFTSDMKPNPTGCSATCCRRRRSDAAILLGLALTCQDNHHVVIQKTRILFKQEADVKKSDNDEHDSDFSCRRASLYLTISVPQLLADGCLGERSMLPTGKRKSPSAKCTPASTQLLLSLIRSDWQNLDDLERAATKAETKSSSDESSLFPTALTLEEVYTRIRGLSSETKDKPRDLNAASNCLLTSLPKEVLISHLAPYLRARSLDNLRRTCWFMHDTLALVVPGLKLRLFTHQIKSLRWMRMRECRRVSESDILSNPKAFHLQQTCGDVHRAATGGATVALVPRHSGESSKSSDIIRVSQETGNEISDADIHTFPRHVARGGLLCDDPGLGKTITVLSLILQTIGLTTKSSRDTSAQKVSTTDNADAVFDAYWSEYITVEFRRPALLKLYWTLLRTNDGARLNQSDEFPLVSGNSQSGAQMDVISLLLIRKKIERDEYKKSFWLFQEDFKLYFQKVRDYFISSEDMYRVVARLSRFLEELVEKFKADQLSAARKSFSNAAARPNSVVAALLDKQTKGRYIEALEPSKSSLLVVPSYLMDHWEHQIRLHVNLNYVSKKDAVIFVFSDTKDSDGQINQLILDCSINKTKSAFVFLDKSTTQQLPSPAFLAMFDIVISTTQRFTNEWKNGSFQDELKRGEMESNSKYFEYEMNESFQESEQACPLLKVRWLRMIVDEGHSMGRGKAGSAILFASWVYAERRWAMTGTPTRQTAADCGISSVSFLMQYLQHDFFSSRRDGDKVWKNNIAKGWKDGCLAAFFRLRALLSLLMIRHTKRDIKELPRPHFQETVLPMSNDEIKSYNSLVWGVQANLVVTAMEAKTSGKQDSLLDSSQSKHAFMATSNVRLACGCFGTKVIATLQEKFHEETIMMLRESQVPGFKLKVVDDHIRRAKIEEYSSCMVCGIQLLALLIFPCGDLVCSECTKSDTTSCPVCNEPFVTDFFQRLQPGFIIEWGLPDNMDGHSTSPTTSLQLDGSFDAEAGMVALQPGRPRKRTRRPKDGHTCRYLPNYFDGKCDLCLEEHDSCNFLNPKNRCSVCYRTAEQCPTDLSKATYVINKLLDLYNRQQLGSTLQSTDSSYADDAVEVDRMRPLKAIIFSQFRKVLNVVGDRLLKRFGAGCVAEYWGRFRQQEIRKFTMDPNCFCMLLGKDGSEGLDLSFVTHIFFLEQVWDKSLQNQTIARAWRMGAKGRVEVETLISEKTVEEVMRKFELNRESQTDATGPFGADTESVWNAPETGSAGEYKHAKLRFILNNLRFIRDDVPSEIPEKRKRKRHVVWKNDDEPEEPAVRFRFGAFEGNKAFVDEFLPPNVAVASVP